MDGEEGGEGHKKEEEKGKEKRGKKGRERGIEYKEENIYGEEYREERR